MSEEIKPPGGEMVLRTLAIPADTNANGDIFGGWLMSQTDIGGAILAKELGRDGARRRHDIPETGRGGRCHLLLC